MKNILVGLSVIIAFMLGMALSPHRDQIIQTNIYTGGSDVPVQHGLTKSSDQIYEIIGRTQVVGVRRNEGYLPAFVIQDDNGKQQLITDRNFGVEVNRSGWKVIPKEVQFVRQLDNGLFEALPPANETN